MITLFTQNSHVKVNESKVKLKEYMEIIQCGGKTA